MKYAKNQMKNAEMIAEDQPFANDRESRKVMIDQLFPHVSLLERFVLSTVLAHEPFEALNDANDPHYFDLSKKDKEVAQYVEYLRQKTKWEQRKLDEKSKGRREPITIYRHRDSETVEPV